MRTYLIQLFLVIAFFAAACSPASEPAPVNMTRTVTDDLGRIIRIPDRIERAISLAPSITESVFAAGAGDRLVGVTSYCNYPPEAGSIAKVGDTLSPNIEKIITLKPDIVFVSTASQLETFTSVLARQNIAVYVSNASNFDDAVSTVRKFGEIFGTEIQADRSADEIMRKAARNEEMLKGLKPVRVFVQISNDPLFTIGKSSFLTEIIHRAGGISVTKDVESAYPKLSKETALALEPEAIILSDSEDNREPNAVFRNSPAVKNGRIYRINADIISRPGPRLVDAIEQIAGFLHRTY